MNTYAISNRYTGEIIYSGEYKSFKDCVEYAVDHGKDLKSVNLTNANLSYANLEWADFEDACLKHAALNGADLEDSSLQGADLSYANLKNANLYDTDLTNTQFSVPTFYSEEYIYRVFIHPDIVQVGCQSLTPEEVLSLTVGDVCCMAERYKVESAVSLLPKLKDKVREVLGL